MIKFSCRQCGKKLGVRDENAGRRVRCPECGGVTVARNEQTDDEWHPTGHECSSCHGSFDGDHVYDCGDTTFICHKCWQNNKFIPRASPGSPRICRSCGQSVNVGEPFFRRQNANSDVNVCRMCWVVMEGVEIAMRELQNDNEQSSS